MEVISKKIPVLITVKQRCDKCKKGYMEQTNPYITLTTYPAQYTHKCTNCGCVQNYTKTYPYSQVVSEEEYKRMINDKNLGE